MTTVNNMKSLALERNAQLFQRSDWDQISKQESQGE